MSLAEAGDLPPTLANPGLCLNLLHTGLLLTPYYLYYSSQTPFSFLLFQV